MIAFWVLVLGLVFGSTIAVFGADVRLDHNPVVVMIGILLCFNCIGFMGIIEAIRGNRYAKSKD